MLAGLWLPYSCPVPSRPGMSQRVPVQRRAGYRRIGTNDSAPSGIRRIADAGSRAS